MASLRPVRVTIAGAGDREDAFTVVDPDQAAVLERLDAVHATLRRPGTPAVPVLVLPAGSRQESQSPRGGDAGTPGQAVAGTVRLEVVVDGWRFEVIVEDAGRADLLALARRGRAEDAAAHPAEVRAIIPGRIAAVAVVVGQQVAHGDPLLVIEAMKMQNELRATRAGTAARVVVQAGQTVDAGDLLVVIE